MDMKMNAEDISLQGVSWDCKVVDGIVPIITDQEDNLQCATIASFLIKGTVPQLPEAGVPWTKYLTKEITFGELDFYIRDSLQKVDKPTYYPNYTLEDESLMLSIGCAETEEAISEL